MKDLQEIQGVTCHLCCWAKTIPEFEKLQAISYITDPEQYIIHGRGGKKIYVAADECSAWESSMRVIEAMRREL